MAAKAPKNGTASAPVAGNRSANAEAIAESVQAWAKICYIKGTLIKEMDGEA
jgi:hypothetical protein